MSNKNEKYPVLKELEKSAYVDIIELSPAHLQKYVSLLAEYYHTSNIGEELLNTYFNLITYNSTSIKFDVEL